MPSKSHLLAFNKSKATNELSVALIVALNVSLIVALIVPIFEYFLTQLKRAAPLNLNSSEDRAICALL